MFTPLHLLPQYSQKEKDRLFDRWQHGTKQGAKDRLAIIEKIKEGGGEDFLQYDFQSGNLPTMENQWDLRGMWIGNLDIKFPRGDNFEAINFSYGVIQDCTLRGAAFPNCDFAYTIFRRCKFIDCGFAYMGLFGASLEDVQFIDCDFVEHFAFSNSELSGATFENCFFQQPTFHDCKFDESTQFRHFSPISHWFPESQGYKQVKTDLAEVYKGIKEGFLEGRVTKQSRQFFFLEKQAVTRHNRRGMEKVGGYFLEAVAGYGVRPQSTFLLMIFGFLLLSIPFVAVFGSLQGLLFGAGAFLTIGIRTELLNTLSPVLQVWYLIETFFGLCFTALLITVLARYWFEER
ncbi:MAG: pentapeptide repeat-containing protein [Candidatus Peregrinibacteria bacterium]